MQEVQLKNLKKQRKAWKPHIINLPTWAFYIIYTIETKINKIFEIKEVCNIEMIIASLFGTDKSENKRL